MDEDEGDAWAACALGGGAYRGGRGTSDCSRGATRARAPQQPRRRGERMAKGGAAEMAWVGSGRRDEVPIAREIARSRLSFC